VNITRFYPDDDATVADVVDVHNAALDADCPDLIPDTPVSYAGAIRYGWDGEVPETYVGRTADGRAVGLLEIHTSEWDNTNLAWLRVIVRPDLRRQGHGSALLEFGMTRAGELGRHSIGGDGLDLPHIVGFARAHGFERRASEINRRQYLDRVDRDVVGKLRDEAARAASGYELVRIVGRSPDDLLEPIAAMTAAINDAPTDDLDIEDEVFTAERIAGHENSMLGRGQRLYRLVARHRSTGELAGHTVVAVERERPEIGWQLDTSVVRTHRGHRLGLLLKSDMLHWLAEVEPQLATLDTWNAESNHHMIAVNEQLGYRMVARILDFQRPSG
jgi:GNAT superfamily N-acetyltransferase